MNRNTQYLVATSEGLITCSTVKRYPDDQAYDKKCKDIVTVRYTDYIREGARTMPIAVRMPAQAGAPSPDPAPIKTNYAPRAVRLAVKDF